MWENCACPGPRRTAVRRGADDVFREAACEVEDRVIAIPPELRRVIVHIRTVPEWRCRLPFIRGEPQTACGIAEIAAAFVHARKPHGKQIAIRALGDRRAVVVPRKKWAGGVRRDFHERLRPGENRDCRIHRLHFERPLPHVLRVQRRRGRREKCALWHFAEHHAEADRVAHRFGNPRAAVRRADEPREARMPAAAEHAEVAVAAAERIGLRARFVGPVPVGAPLGDIAMHVGKSPRIRRCLSDVERGDSLDVLEFRPGIRDAELKRKAAAYPVVFSHIFSPCARQPCATGGVRRLAIFDPRHPCGNAEPSLFRSVFTAALCSPV